MFEFFLIIYQFSKWVGFTAHKMINKFFEVSLWIQEFRHIWYISPLLLLLLFNFSHLWPRAASLYCLMSHLIQSQTSLMVPLPFFFEKIFQSHLVLFLSQTYNQSTPQETLITFTGKWWMFRKTIWVLGVLISMSWPLFVGLFSVRQS